MTTLLIDGGHRIDLRGPSPLADYHGGVVRSLGLSIHEPAGELRTRNREIANRVSPAVDGLGLAEFRQE